MGSSDTLSALVLHLNGKSESLENNLLLGESLV